MLQRIILYCLTSCLSFYAVAQKDHTGNYGFSFKVDKELEATKDENDTGPIGTLTLIKIDSSKYKFWLDVSRGYPSYNIGNADGFINVKNNTAIYKAALDYTDAPCEIKFSFLNNLIEVEQLSAECGFGASVYADGKYKKLDAKRVKNTDLEKIYSTARHYKIIVAKAFLFEDKEGFVVKKQYFIMNDNLLSPRETSTMVYVEYVTATGKFIYGWLKKTGLKTVK